MILFAVLILAILGAVLYFSINRSKSNKAPILVNVWGTYPAEVINNVQLDLNKEKENTLNISYKQFSETEFPGKLVEALASGYGPDVILASGEQFLAQENKIFKIPYNSFPQKNFKDNFIEAGEFLLYPDGVMGIPYAVDPLVMYWNRSILNNSGVSVAPKKWSEFLSLVPSLVVRDSATNNISKAGVAMGEFQNISNAKEIFINLMFQSGNPIIVKSTDSNNNLIYKSVFAERLGFSAAPADAALNFFGQFVDPTKNIYSWNRSLPKSQDMFLANDLAFYFGFASEYPLLQQKNPNLNFEVAEMPQTTSGVTKTVYSKLYFLSVMKNSKNPGGSLNAILKLVEKNSMVLATKYSGLPSVRRDVLGAAPDSSVLQVFNNSALVSKPFIDPNYKSTSLILKNMIESYTTGRTKSSQAITQASNEFNMIFGN